MIVIKADLWLCQDCTIVACNGDASGIETQEQAAKVAAGVEALGYTVSNWDSRGDGTLEFSRCACDSCGSRLAGTRNRFAILGEST